MMNQHLPSCWTEIGTVDFNYDDRQVDERKAAAMQAWTLNALMKFAEAIGRECCMETLPAGSGLKKLKILTCGHP